MHYTKEDIENLERVERLKIINSVTGIKPANLIGTIDDRSCATNVAIFSSVFHLGSNPALLGFIMRPAGDVPRHTYNNIKQNGFYTINHIHPAFTKNAHYTSAKFDESVSEFDSCNLTEEYLRDFKAPFVKESTFKMGLRFKEAIDITVNGTILIIGEIEHLVVPENAIVEGNIDLEASDSVGISGLNSYYSLKKIEEHPYARLKDVPSFKR